MAVLVTAIHVFGLNDQDVDARDVKPVLGPAKAGPEGPRMTA